MSDCKTIKEITEEVIKSGNAEIIPYNLEGLSLDCYLEVIALYLKYGKDEERKNICRLKYMEYKDI